MITGRREISCDGERDRRGWAAIGIRLSLGCWLVVCGCRDGGDVAKNAVDGDGVVASSSGSPETLSAEIARLRSEEQYGRAIQILESRRAKLRGDAAIEAHRWLGECLLEIGVEDRAGRVATEGLRLRADSPLLRELRAEVLRRLAQYEEAGDLLEELLRGGQLTSLGVSSLASVRLRLGDAEGALELFERYFREVPRSVSSIWHATRLEHGRALRAARRLEEAADLFTRVLEEDPSQSAAYSELAATLYRRREKPAAKFVEALYKGTSQRSFEEYGEEKLRTLGREALAFSQRALLQEERRRFAAALRDHEAAQRLNLAEGGERDVRVVLYHAEALAKFHRVQQSKALLVRARKLGCRPASGLHEWIGKACLEEGDAPGALRAFQLAAEALEMERAAGERRGVHVGQADEVGIETGQVRARVEAGQSVEALQSAERARSLAPAKWQTHYWSARAYLAAGRAAEAKRDFQRAVEVAQAARENPGAEFFLWLTEADRAVGDEEKAYQRLRAALEQAPGHVEFWKPLIEGAERFEPARVEELRQRERVARAVRVKLAALKGSLESRPIEACAKTYAEIAVERAKQRDPGCLDDALLASDLDPTLTEPCYFLLGQLKSQGAVFERLRILRRLMEAAPKEAVARQQAVAIYLQLRVRLAEAERRAREAHAIERSEKSLALLIEVLRARGKKEEAARLFREAGPGRRTPETPAGPPSGN